MPVSIINGYVCYSGCDAAKARTGQDPHPKSDQSGAATTATAGGVQNPAVVFGGSLAGRDAVAPAASSQQAGPINLPPNGVDLYA